MDTMVIVVITLSKTSVGGSSLSCLVGYVLMQMNEFPKLSF